MLESGPSRSAKEKQAYDDDQLQATPQIADLNAVGLGFGTSKIDVLRRFLLHGIDKASSAYIVESLKKPTMDEHQT